MLPFSVDLKPGAPVYEQVVYSVKKAMVSGLLSPGDEFPSVRTISQQLKINPNTAHKIVAALISEGLLAVRPGIGTFVSQAPAGSKAERTALLEDEVEQLVVEARRLSLQLQDVLEAVRKHWNHLKRP
jgi:GntR family transcriptional regulator